MGEVRSCKILAITHTEDIHTCTLLYRLVHNDAWCKDDDFNLASLQASVSSETMPIGLIMLHVHALHAHAYNVLGRGRGGAWVSEDLVPQCGVCPGLE